MKSYSLFFVRLFIGLSLLCLVQAARAQPGSGGPNPQPGAPTDIPLDGGVSLLLAAGVGLGLRRLRRRQPG